MGIFGTLIIREGGPSFHHRKSHSLSNSSTMDPATAFGIAAGVAQFVDLAVNVSLCLSTYIQTVIYAPKRSRELQQEACLVSLILEKLKSTLGTINNTKLAMDLTNTLNDTIDEFSKTLIAMENHVVKDGQFIQRLKWPFTEKENEKYLSSLERSKITFTLALTIIQRFTLNAALAKLIL